MVLDRNPENYFADVEQSAYSPANMVPGIEPSPDKMLQVRREKKTGHVLILEVDLARCECARVCVSTCPLVKVDKLCVLFSNLASIGVHNTGHILTQCYVLQYLVKQLKYRIVSWVRVYNDTVFSWGARLK